MLCASSVIAQNDTLTISKDNAILDLGRNVSYMSQEVTGAISTVNADGLSHKNNSINPTNNLFGLLSGLQVLQGNGAAWEDGASLYIRGMGTTNS